MNIKPYVYLCTHKTTNEFYIGYREANKEPSHIDLPKYKTSAIKIKKSFDQFNWIIVAEFFDGNDAYDFEQQLIHENWSNPLLLNRVCFYGKKQFKTPKGIPKSNEHKAKISKLHKGKIVNQESRDKISKARIGIIQSTETKLKMSDSHLGLNHSEETKSKMRKSSKKSLHIIIDGIQYFSINEAHIKTGIPHRALRKMV